jgi:hypothetical protein
MQVLNFLKETKPLAKENKVLMSFQPMKDSPSIEKEDHEDTNDVKLPLLNISQRERRQSKPNKRFLRECRTWDAVQLVDFS